MTGKTVEIQDKATFDLLTKAYDEAEEVYFDNLDGVFSDELRHDADDNMRAITLVARLVLSESDFQAFEGGRSV